MIDYTQFPGLAGVYLEDSYVRVISDAPAQFVFNIDAVLTPENSAYQAPRPGEHYCYALGSLVFDEVTRTEWVKKTQSHFTDATGEEDLGNIDILRIEGNAFVLEGDWGEVRIFGAPPRFDLDA